MWARGWIAIAVLGAGLVTVAPAGAGQNADAAPGLVRIAGPDATVVPAPDGGFTVTMPELYPFAEYTGRRLGRGERVPAEWAAPLAEREETTAVLRRPDAPDDADILLVELTDTEMTDAGGFTAHAAPVDDADDPLLPRVARGDDDALDPAPAPLELVLPDPDGEMRDTMPPPRSSSGGGSGSGSGQDFNYEVISNNIFNFTPLPNSLVYEPQSSNCLREFVRRQTSEFTDSWITLRGFTVESEGWCWFQASEASYTVKLDDMSLNLTVKQDYPSSDFNVTRCDGTGFVCHGTKGYKTFTINIFKR
jgi:hypothetical protein